MFGLMLKKTCEKLLKEKESEILEIREALDKVEKQKNELLNNPENLKDILIDAKIQELTSEVNKIKKELENAEEELEDLEDEFDDEKKKHQKKKEEFKELQESFLAVEGENKANKEQLEIAQKKNNEQSEKLVLKESSLDFVKEILNAKEITAGNSNDKFGKINSVIEYIYGDFRDFLLACNIDIDKETANVLFGEGLVNWEATEKKAWLKNKKTVAFIGEFSSGKTSIVNKILMQGGTKDLLPVSTKATTAIPTYISASNTNVASYNFFTPDNRIKLISEKTFKKVDKGILAEIEGVSSLIKYFIMSYNNDNLKNLSILDTPGFTSNDKEDAERTIEVINENDALFWVFDVNAGTVNRSSLKVIKDNLHKPLYVIINKIDTKAPSEVDKVESLIKDTFKKEKIDVKGYIRFSYNEAPDKILDVIKSLPDTNNSYDYIGRLESYLEELKDKLYKDASEAKKEEAKYETEFNNCIDEVNSAMKVIQEKCGDIFDTIKDSPEGGIFTSFIKISPETFQEIESLLGDIVPIGNDEDGYSEAVDMDNLVNSINELQEATAPLTAKYNEVFELDSRKKAFDDIYKQLKKRINAVKEGN